MPSRGDKWRRQPDSNISQWNSWTFASRRASSAWAQSWISPQSRGCILWGSAVQSLPPWEFHTGQWCGPGGPSQPRPQECIYRSSQESQSCRTWKIMFGFFKPGRKDPLLVLLFKELLFVRELLLIRLKRLVWWQLSREDISHQASNNHPCSGASFTHLSRKRFLK